MFSYDKHDSVRNAGNQVPSEIRKNDVNLQAQVKPLPIYGLASDLTPTLRNRWQALQEAKSAAENALRLSSDLSEAHVSLGHVLVLHDWDWRRAEEEYHRALALDPNSAQAHNLYGELLQVQGRTEEAVREAEKAGQLDPINLQGAVGWPLYTARQYDQAEKLFRRYSIHIGLAWVYMATARYPQAITELQAEEGGRVPTEIVLASWGRFMGCRARSRRRKRCWPNSCRDRKRRMCLPLSWRTYMWDWVTGNARFPR
jgi:tetratricopeptide (TPR) repeat protein